MFSFHTSNTCLSLISLVQPPSSLFVKKKKKLSSIAYTIFYQAFYQKMIFIFVYFCRTVSLSRENFRIMDFKRMKNTNTHRGLASSTIDNSDRMLHKMRKKSRYSCHGSMAFDILLSSGNWTYTTSCLYIVSRYWDYCNVIIAHNTRTAYLLYICSEQGLIISAASRTLRNRYNEFISRKILLYIFFTLYPRTLLCAY